MWGNQVFSEDVRKLSLSTKTFAFVSLLLIGALAATQAGTILPVQAHPNSNQAQHTADAAMILSVNATGQANPIQGGNESNVILNFTATIRTNPGGQLKISNVTGMLRIGSTNYTLISGEGVENRKGMVEIHAQTNGTELILHGTFQGNVVVFSSPQSKLASLDFLSLQGKSAVKT